MPFLNDKPWVSTQFPSGISEPKHSGWLVFGIAAELVIAFIALA